MPPPGLGRSIRIGHGDRIALRCTGIVAGAIAQPPNLALIISEEPVPTVEGKRVQQILAGAGIVQLNLVFEEHLPDRRKL